MKNIHTQNFILVKNEHKEMPLPVIDYYKNNLIEISNELYEAELKKEITDEDKKDAIQDAVLKLLEKPTRESIEAITGEREVARAYFGSIAENCYINNFNKDKRERIKRAKLEEPGESSGRFLDLLDELVIRQVPLSEKEIKLWEMVIDFMPNRIIMEKMGYKNLHITSQNKHLLILKVREYAKKLNLWEKIRNMGEQ